MPTLKDLVVRIKTDDSELDSGLNTANGKVDGFANKVDGTVGSSAKQMAMIGGGIAIAVGGGILAAANVAGHFAEEIHNLSATTGLSAEGLQRLRFVAKTVGIEFESLANTSTMLERKLMGIESDNGMAAKAMERLGISVQDSNGNLRSMNELFPEAITRLQGLQNSTERNAIASQIFGRNLGAIAPILSMTSKEFEELKAKAGIMSDKDIEEARKFQETMNKLQMTLGGLTRKIGMEFMPVIKDNLVPTIENGVVPALRLFSTVGKDAVAVISVIPGGSAAVSVMLALALATKTFQTALSPLRDIYTSVTAKLATKTAATAADTVATTAAAAAEEKLTAAQVKAMLTAEADSTAVAANTVAKEANAAATVGLGSKIGATFKAIASSSTFWVTVAVGSLLYLQHTIQKTLDKAKQDSRTGIEGTEKQKSAYDEATKKTLSGYSADKLAKDAQATRDKLKASNEEIKKLEKEVSTSMWRDAVGILTMGSGKGSAVVAADLESAKAEKDRLEKRLDLIDEVKKEGGKADTELDDQQKKRLAAIEKANNLASQQMEVLAQTDETKRKLKEAEFELKNKEADINATAKAYYDETGKTVDVSQQIFAAEAAYREKVKEINKEAEKATKEKRDTAEKKQATIQAAQLELQAVGVLDEHERAILKERANLIKTLQELRASGATEAEIRLAQKQSDAEIARLQREHTDDMYADMIGSATSGKRAEILKIEDKDEREFQLSRLSAAEKLMNTMLDLKKKADQGKNVTAQANEAVSAFQRELTDLQTEKAKADLEKAQKNQDAYNQAIAESQAAQMEALGDVTSAKLKRLETESANKLNQIDRNKDLDERARNAQRNAALLQSSIERQKILKEDADAEADLVSKKIIDIRKENDERQRAFNDEMNRRKSAINYTTLEDRSRELVKSGFTSRYQPMADFSRDTATPASSEIRVAMSRLVDEQQRQNRLTQDLISEVKRLGGMPKIGAF